MITSWNITRLLSRMSRRAAPDRAFDLALRHKLADAGYLPMRRFGSFAFPSWKTAGVSFSLALSLAGGTGVYAYTSNEVLPSHPLYGVRVALERAELDLPQSEQQRGNIRLKHLQRRVSEAGKLNARHLPVPKSHREELLANLAAVSAASQEESDVSDSASEQANESRELVNMDHQELSDLIDERQAADSDEDVRVIDDELSHQMERVNEDLKRMENDREAGER